MTPRIPLCSLLPGLSRSCGTRLKSWRWPVPGVACPLFSKLIHVQIVQLTLTRRLDSKPCFDGSLAGASSPCDAASVPDRSGVPFDGTARGAPRKGSISDTSHLGHTFPLAGLFFAIALSNRARPPVSITAPRFAKFVARPKRKGKLKGTQLEWHLVRVLHAAG